MRKERKGWSTYVGGSSQALGWWLLELLEELPRSKTQVSPVTVLKWALTFLTTFYFYSLHFNTKICHFQNRLVTLVLMEPRGVNDLYFWSSHAAFPKITRLMSANQCTSCMADAPRQKQTEERRLSVSVLQRHCRPLPLSLYSLSVFLLGTLYQIQNDHIWRPENETQLLNTFLVRLWTARTNLADPNSKFNSLWIILTWREVQLALNRMGC